MPKLPKNLPPLPPVPDGYDRWKLCGWGGLIMDADGTPWGCAWLRASDWNVENQTKYNAIGSKSLYYIVAVRDPKPAPTIRKFRKVAAPKPRKGRVVASKLATSDYHLNGSGLLLLARGNANAAYPIPVFLLSADSASVERMLEQAAEALANRDGFTVLDANAPGMAYRDRARLALAAIGITAKGGLCANRAEKGASA